MTTYNPIQKPATIGSLMLGNFSTFWGFVVAPLYVVGFVLILPNVMNHGNTPGPASGLPLELPFIGLFLGVVGLALSRYASRATLLPSMLGIVLNGVPMALALALWILGGALGTLARPF